ncbi:hypothetical protein KSX_34180 [Ktedonospora formicarum]|uniref:Uncharacterized protein n=1 Tax=Ktedonospora formicarum TaxID=2778364 RepID=A0A8J3I1V6_9CHLR|nr:hypothetical protein KSX_34180 [Ktedonospora formicarum]
MPLLKRRGYIWKEALGRAKQTSDATNVNRSHSYVYSSYVAASLQQQHHTKTQCKIGADRL